MPGNRFNGFTDYGIGIGLRAPHYEHILSRKPVVDWFEIISENFMIDGGRPLRILDQILDQYKVVQHGVAMYFGSAHKPDREHLRRLKELVKRTNTLPRKRFETCGTFLRSLLLSRTSAVTPNFMFRK